MASVVSGAPGAMKPASSRLARNSSGLSSTHSVRTMSMSGRRSSSVKCLTSPKSRNVTRPPPWNR